ncbi:hypothetical protein [Treponema denticola]|uniref:hypothetical protein n=1 Tax=Treponema denticola TaxID=158 RepID=UPI003D940DF3
MELTYKEAFLQKYEQGSGSLNPTITLKATDGRVFKKTYTFGIKSNTPPPKPAVVLAKTKIDALNPASYYVLCIDTNDLGALSAFVNGKYIHDDIAYVTINGTRYNLKMNDAHNGFSEKPAAPSFLADGTGLMAVGSAQLPSGAWVLYYKTDIQIGPGNPETSYTITLIDKGGVTSDEAVKTIAASGPTHTVTFGVEGGIGTLTAKVDGNSINSGDGVEQGKTVIFTANPDTANGYEVEKWTVDGNEISGYTGTEYTLSSITEPKTVKVRFKQNTHTVTFKVEGEGGSLYGQRSDTGGGGTAYPSIPRTFYNVPSGTKVEFTASPDNNDWKVEGWTISYGIFESGGGTGATNAILKVTGDTTVTVKFYRSSIPASSTWRDLLFAVKNAPQNGTITIKGYGAITATSAPGDHGEIVIDKDLTIRGDSLSVYLDANNLSRIFKVKEGKTLTLEQIKLKNGKVEATEEGGGVYNDGTLIMKGGSFIGGCVAGKGGGVYNNGTLIMEKFTEVTPSAGTEQYTEGKNDVYLKKDKMITVNDAWTGSSLVARIRPESYSKTVKVLTGSTVSANHTRFTVTPDSETGMPWYIDAGGNLNIDEVGVSNENELEAAINGATTDKPRVITVKRSFDTTKHFVIPYKKNITIKDDGTRRTLICKEVGGGHNHFEVQSGGRLTFRGKITLKGKESSFNHGYSQYALFVKTSGTAEIADNVIITGFINKNSAAVYTNGKLIMSGGTIKSNEAEDGGGVCIGSYAHFTMTGGTIEHNRAKNGGGVYMNSGSTFEMTGGTITGNTATTNGKAVWVRGTFDWKGGTITGNHGNGDAVHINGGTINNTSGNTPS